MKKLLLPLLAAFALFPWAASAAALSIGDPAPELKASQWVKGGPVDGLDPYKNYVVEFWATWCGPCRSSIPHLTELAHQFPDVTFIGMNVWERGQNAEKAVAKFVTDMGEKMDYSVAMDTSDGFMVTNWMEAAEQNGIPTAFLVQQGKVIWIGHPMAGLDEALKEVVAGTFDIEKAKKRADADKRMEAFYMKAMNGASDEELAEEGAALEALDAEFGNRGPDSQKFNAQTFIRQARFGAAMHAYQKALYENADEADVAKLEAAARAAAPEGEDFDIIKEQMLQRIHQSQEMRKVQDVVEKYIASVGENGDPKKAAPLAKQIEEMNIQDPDMLNELAWSILTDEKVKQRDLPLATRLAKKAMDLSVEKNANILDTYARAMFDTGQITEAIEYQKKAIAACQDDSAKQEMESTLERYQTAPGGAGLPAGPDAAAPEWMQEFNLPNRSLVDAGRNPYFILEPGYKLVFESADAKLVITVLNDTVEIGGIRTRVVEEREWENGDLVEVSRNFFAMDKDTLDVFYFGEEVDDYQDGAIRSHGGAWRADTAGAKAGLAMPGTPKAGMKYYLEVAPGIAMDRAEIVSLDEKFTTPAGEFTGCLKTQEGSALKPQEKEFKIYAPGIGLLRDGDMLLVKYWFDDAP